MALPVTIPNEFANATASIPLSQLDTNFTTLANAVNGISSGSETLANASVTVLTAGTVDINGGNIDGTAIGGSTPAAGSFTTLNTSGQVVFNDAGADVDFRVEGDTDANLLFVDASADNVGIGTSSPDAKLTITRGLTSAYSIKMVRGNRTDQGIFTDGPGISLRGVDATNGATFVRVGGDNTDSNDYDHIGFAVEGSERGRFTVNGLCFNGDTAAANALDDYEEGTFTVTLTPNGGSMVMDSARDTMQYVKIGRMVHCQGYVRPSTVSSPTGVITFSLPFTATSGTEFSGHVFGVAIGENIASGVGNGFSVTPTKNTVTATLYYTAGGIASANWVAVGEKFINNTNITISLVYQTA